MVQATDGNWYAYFANVEKAKIADSTVGLAGKGLDFGVFVEERYSDSVFGISLTETDGFAVPSPSGLGSSTNGDSSFSFMYRFSYWTLQFNNNVVRKRKNQSTQIQMFLLDKLVLMKTHGH